MSSTFIKTLQVPNLVCHQIYLWFLTNDLKVILVSTKPDKWQLPGGKPNKDEKVLETINRELFEETGITLLEDEFPKLFGYYLVDNDPNWQEKKYSQLRFCVKSKRNSSDIKLSINEPEDNNKVLKVEFMDLSKVIEYIPWMKDDADEYNAVKSLLT